MKRIREQVLKCLARLSQIIGSIKSYIQLYTGDVVLRQKAEDLYLAILEAVECMMTWLNHKPGSEDQTC